jgi:nitrogenase-stabilizing/protective protein
MSPLVASLRELSSAEEILNFFDVAFDPRVVNVNRLHILKRFNQYLAQSGNLAGLDNAAALDSARAMLLRAYEDFIHSTAVEQKVFKVFRDPSVQRISIDSLRPAHA